MLKKHDFFDVLGGLRKKSLSPRDLGSGPPGNGQFTQLVFEWEVRVCSYGCPAPTNLGFRTKFRDSTTRLLRATE